MDITAYREALVDRAAVAFSRDAIDEAAFERLASRIQAAANESELRLVDAELAPLVPLEAGSAASADPASSEREEPRPQPRERALESERALSLSMANFKKQGRWVDARRYSMDASMSTLVFDFRAYAQEDLEMNLDMDLSMSTLRLLVPDHWDVDIRIDNNAASTVRDRGPRSHEEAGNEGAAVGTGHIVITGSLSMSTLVIKRKRLRRRHQREGRRRGLFHFFLWRS